MSAPALPHRWRLWAILIVTVLDLAALIAAHAGVGAELLGELRPLVETGLGVALAIFAPALGDAYMVERRRRDPRVPALPDDVAARLVRPTAADLRAAAEPETARAIYGCEKCGKPIALVGDPIPDDGLCQWCTDEVRPARLPAGAGLALALVIVAAALSAATSGCSTGPQLPVTATPQNTSCNYTITIGAIPSDDASIVAPSGTDGTAGVIVSDNDCSIDRIAASADPTTVGNEIGPVEVSPDTDVSAIPSVP